MKIAIVGAGFTGLAAALRLVKSGHEVVVFEKETEPGGLAIGFKDSGWKWPLEKHYHHLFESDWEIRKLAQEVGVKIDFKRVKTAVWWKGGAVQLDSVGSLLAFGGLPFIERIRTGLGLAILKFRRGWKDLEKVTAKSWIQKWMGKRSWEVVWEPLFVNKFGRFADEVSAAWFWARIVKRSASLGYPRGGFLALARKTVKTIEKLGGEFRFGESTTLEELKGKYDKVIWTVPAGGAVGLGAMNVVLALKRQFLTDGTYWLSMNELGWPFLAVVEQTNMVSPKYYGEDRLVYVGKYLEKENEYMTMSDREVLERYMPYLQKINPKFRKGWIRKIWVFRAGFAQPVFPLEYSKKIPPIEEGNVYMATMLQVYPWDRGTNYAVELGNEVASRIGN